MTKNVNLVGAGTNKTIFNCEYFDPKSTRTIIFSNNFEKTYENEKNSIEVNSGEIQIKNFEYSVGDLLKFVDEEAIENKNVMYFKGEVGQITDFSDSFATLKKPLSFNYTRATVQKISGINDIVIENITLIGLGIEKNQVCFSFYGSHNITFNQLRIQDWGIAGISLTDSINCTIQYCEFDNIYYTGLGYSILLSNACDDTLIKDCNFTTLGRHYIATGAGTGDILNGGWVKRTRVENCTFNDWDIEEEAINSHNTGYGPMEIVNCDFKSGGKGVETSNMHTYIDGCNFTDVIIPFHFIQKKGYTKTHIVKNCIINPIKHITNTRSIIETSNVEFINNDISIRIDFYSPYSILKNFKLENNTFRNMVYAVKFIECDYITAKNNDFIFVLRRFIFKNCGNNIFQ